MKNIKTNFAVILTALVISSAPASVFAGSANVRIVDGGGNTLCHMDFTGTKGMDSIINTASSCGFSYTLGWGDNYLDTINGVGWDGTNYWVLYVDNVYANQGVNDYNLNDINEILWAYSDGTETASWFKRSAGSFSGEGIVGLINPSTGGMPDFDGDGTSDVEERKNGTDPYIDEAGKKSKESQMANTATGFESMESTLKEAISQLMEMLNFVTGV